MTDSRHFAEKGFRIFDGTTTLDLSDSEGNHLSVFAIEAWTDTELSDTEGDCAFVKGQYSPDESLLGSTIPAGKLLYVQLSKCKVASGSGIAYLR